MMKKTTQLLMLLALTLTLGACRDDWDRNPYRGHELVGSWEAFYYVDNFGSREIASNEVDVYEFYNNGRGNYAFYDNLGRWTSVEFLWEDRGRGAIFVDYADGVSEMLYYDFDNRNNLILSRDYNFNSYFGYFYRR